MPHSTLKRPPSQLLDKNNWVRWRYVDGDPEPRKVPFQKNGKPAKSNDPTTWTAYDDALAGLNGTDAGLGFVFDGSGICGVDLDGCRRSDGSIEPWARDILKDFPTYAEVSPSGTGVKLWALGRLKAQGKKRNIDAPVIGKKKPAVEVYDKGRYFAYTGQRLDGHPGEVVDCQPQLDRLYSQLCPTAEPSRPTTSSTRSDDDTIRRARAYIEKLPPAVSGSGGHNTTFHAACVLVLGFGLNPESAYPILAEWNTRCTPPWSDRDLRRKLDEADKQPGERGYLLRGGEHARTVTPSTRKSEPLPWVPFPAEVLPRPAARFISQVSEAVGCDPSFVALPLLAGFATAIGNARKIRIKSSWTEPPILWASIVGESGTAKSPPIELALAPLRDRQNIAMKVYREQHRQYLVDVEQYRRALDQWKKRNIGGDPPEPPAEPIAERYTTTDATIEALAAILAHNPRGLLSVRDELAGLFADFDRYSKGRPGGDAARWLELHGARPLTVDRKAGLLYIPRAAVSLIGAIQPGVLRRCLGSDHRESGLAARLLFAWPPRRPRRWTDDDVDPSVDAGVRRIYDRLLALEMETGAGGDPEPILVGLTSSGRQAFRSFVDEHGAEQMALVGDEAAAWSKLEGYGARLSLVIHLIRCAADDATVERHDAVDVASVSAAVKLVRWFGCEARRIYSMFHEADDDRGRRQLADLIRARGGRITARDLMRGTRDYPNAADAESALSNLAEHGFGRWEYIDTTDHGGRPTRQFRLTDGGAADTTPANPGENGGCVDNSTRDEWGEV